MFVRKYHIVVHGNPIDPMMGTTSTGTLTHHRMFWSPITAEDIKRAEEESAEANKWKNAIAVGIYPLNYYGLWGLHKEVATDGGLVRPAGMPEWMRKAYNYVHNKKWRKP